MTEPVTKEREQLAAVKLALYVIQAWENGCHRDDYWSERDDAITALQSIIEQPAPVQGSIPHCEAGPDYCQQCHLEDRSLALAAAVRYVQNNTPKLVSDEICMALTTPPNVATPLAAQQKPWVDLFDEQIDALRNQYPPSAGIDFDVRCREFARAIEAKIKAKNERKEKNT